MPAKQAGGSGAIAITARRVDAGASAPHPNEVDARRIARALERRARYRYVTPTIETVAGGYRIASPCCSRNVDPSGGTIDIARLEYVDSAREWRLYSKDHDQDGWLFHGASARLDVLLAELNEDSTRTFWR